MTSKVYFFDIREGARDSILNGIEKIFDAAEFDKLIEPEDLTAVKTHFGERGNLAYVRPPIIKTIVDKIKSYNGKPFLTDSNVLYRGSRGDAVTHIETAVIHGFSYSNIGAPIIIADGLEGKEYKKVKIDQRHFKEVNIGTTALNADSIISVAHFKGHEVTGFGGSLKNIGMGFASRSGKQQMHADVRPVVIEDKCNGDAKCLKWCPADAIKMINKKARIDSAKCIGCAECIASCRSGAIKIDWTGTAESLQEKMVEYFYGVAINKKEKMGYINIIMDVSPQCDCYPFNNIPIVPNIGFAASLDPVSLDQSSADLVNKQEGIEMSALGSHFKSGNKFRVLNSNVDWEIQLKYAEKLGLGSRKYELIKV